MKKRTYEQPWLECVTVELQEQLLTTSTGFDYDNDNNWAGGVVPQD